MIKVALFTTTRAEFGILSPLLSAIKKNKEITYLLFVGGTHLSKDAGYTIEEINKHRFRITGVFDYLISNSYDCYSLAKGLSVATNKVAEIFKNHDFDIIGLVGDRYELLSIVSNAILFKKPIIHIHGGEKSEGTMDEQIRHMITKAAHLHFVACQEYAENICRMGEPDWRIYNTGALGIDNIVKSKRIPKKTIFAEFGLAENKPLAILTYHPSTLEFKTSLQDQIQNVFSALNSFDLQVVITSPNIEAERNQIIHTIQHNLDQNPDYIAFDSLGIKKYHSLIPYCEFVIGNSSSGIIEVPFFKIPTVNVGDRQKGRTRHQSVIDTDYSVTSIKTGIQKALSKDFKDSIKKMQFKFGNGHAAERMVGIIKKIKIDQDFLRKRLEPSD